MSGDRIKSVLGSDQVASVATKLGISPDAAAAKIADVLPTVIDRVTPDGVVPDPHALAAGLTGFIKMWASGPGTGSELGRAVRPTAQSSGLL